MNTILVYIYIYIYIIIYTIAWLPIGSPKKECKPSDLVGLRDYGTFGGGVLLLEKQPLRKYQL